jgi:hypothetical protein
MFPSVNTAVKGVEANLVPIPSRSAAGAGAGAFATSLGLAAPSDSELSRVPRRGARLRCY